MPDWEGVEDSQLLRIAQEGNSEAFGEVYERYAKVIFRYLYAHVNERLDAEDLTEEVFLRVWRTLPNFREQGVPFAAYLYHIARNALIDHHRRTQRSARDVTIEDGQVATPHPDPADLAFNHLEHQELRFFLGQLRDDYRDVLVLRFLSELSPEETAVVMERSVGAIRVLQHRALSAIRKFLVKSQSEE